jgi:hypothetical protein
MAIDCVAITNLLIEAKASLEARTLHGGTPLECARSQIAVIHALQGTEESAEEALAKLPEEERDIRRKLIGDAPKEAYELCVRLLLRAGAIDEPYDADAVACGPFSDPHSPEAAALISRRVRRQQLSAHIDSPEEPHASFDCVPKSYMDYHAQPACAHCGVLSPALKKCDRCRAVFYCGRDCQKKHWRQHKKDCCRQRRPCDVGCEALLEPTGLGSAT